jgi:hypothetical protein
MRELQKYELGICNGFRGARYRLPRQVELAPFLSQLVGLPCHMAERESGHAASLTFDQRIKRRFIRNSQYAIAESSTKTDAQSVELHAREQELEPSAGVEPASSSLGPMRSLD